MHKLRIVFLGMGSSQDIYFGTGQFEVDTNMSLIMVGIKACFPFGSVAVSKHISACI